MSPHLSHRRRRRARPTGRRVLAAGQEAARACLCPGGDALLASSPSWSLSSRRRQPGLLGVRARRGRCACPPDRQALARGSGRSPALRRQRRHPLRSAPPGDAAGAAAPSLSRQPLRRPARNRPLRRPRSHRRGVGGAGAGRRKLRRALPASRRQEPQQQRRRPRHQWASGQTCRGFSPARGLSWKPMPRSS